MKPGERVRWPELTNLAGQPIPAGTGVIIGRNNVADMIRSDKIRRVHTRSDGTTWNEHELLWVSPDQLKPE